MTIHTPVFLRVYEPGSTIYSVQNYYHSTVVIDGDRYQFMDFGVDGLQATASADTNEITVTMPALSGAIEMAGSGTGSSLVSVTAYQFAAATAPESPPVGQATLLQFIGQITRWSLEGVSTLAIVVGSSLSPIEAQFPAGRYDSSKVGIPCRL